VSKELNQTNLLVLSISLAASSLSFANSDEQGIEEITVYGELSETESATKLNLTVFETPQTVTTISRAQLDDFALNKINDVLNYSPGVTVEEVETDRTYYTARGFDVVNFQYDGIGIPFISGLNLGQQDTAIYQKVEVVKGAAGLVTGLANPSATINYVRKRPTHDLKVGTTFSISEWSGFRLGADVSGALSSKIRGRAVVAYDEGDSYLDRHSDQTKLGYGVFEFDLSDSTLLTVGHSYDSSSSDSVLWGALPLTYSDGSATDYDVSTSNAPDWTLADTEQSQTFAELNQQLGGNWSLNAILTRNETEYESELFYVYGAPDPITELGLAASASGYGRNEKQINADIFVSGNFSVLGRTHELVVGYNRSDTELTEASFSDPTIIGPIVLGSDWAEGNTPRPHFTAHDPATSASDIDYTQKAFYVASRLNVLDNLSILLGARATEFDQSGISYGGSTQADAKETVPYYGVTYQVLDDVMLYASYSEVFKQQTWVDATLQPLGSTLGDSQEAGVKKSFNNGLAILTFAIFSSEQKNFGTFVGRNANNIAIYEGVSLQSEGYEIEISGELLEGLNVGAGFTKVDIEDENGSGIRPFIPSKLLKLSATYQIPAIDGLRVGGLIKWQDDITSDGAAAEQKAYTTLDLAVHYQVRDNMGVSLNIENLSDEKYLNSLFWSQAYYGAPRNVSASVRFSF